MGKRIVLAEDIRSTREVVSFLLANRGFEVIESANGNDTLEKVRTLRPDLLILDSDMPEKSGYDVFRELRMDEASRKLPVLFLVADSDVIDVTKTVPPAECLVAKPFTAHDLIQRITRMLA